MDTVIQHLKNIWGKRCSHECFALKKNKAWSTPAKGEALSFQTLLTPVCLSFVLELKCIGFGRTMLRPYAVLSSKGARASCPPTVHAKFGTTRITTVLVLFLLLTSGVLSANSPQRIVSIAPGFTEILYALGAGGNVVGTTNYCDYPPEAKNTEKIGDVLNPNIEKIIALKPDIVFCGAWKWKVPEQLRAVGITVVEIPDAENIQDILDRFQFIGNQIGKGTEAKQLVQQAKERLQAIRMKHSDKEKRKSVFIEIDSGNWTAGGTSYVSELLGMVGLRNIFDDREEPYLMVTMESIAARAPDLIITWTRTREELQAVPAWQSVEAVKRGAILDKNAMDWNSIVRQGPRMIEGMEELEGLLDHMR